MTKRGFTLVELVVVMAIILILAAILLPIVANRIEDARISRLAAEYRTIKTAVTMYYADTALLPADFMDLYDPSTKPDGWRGPYIDKRPMLVSGNYVLYSPFGTYMQLAQGSNKRWDGILYDLYTYLIVDRDTPGGDTVITDNIYLRIDSRIDDGDKDTGIVQVDSEGLKFFLLGIMP